ncbi:MAG: ABC transporter permease [Chloroflexi bacterium]|nr:ABC transporter permease [Chloroflexota bacterium]
MQRFLIRRFITTIVTLFAVSLIIFTMSRAAGDPRTILLNDFATQEQWDEVGIKLGLDKPYIQQYGIFLRNMLRGNFGDSIKERRPVIDVIVERTPATLQLGAVAFALSLVVGIPLGIFSAVRRGSILDQFGKLVSLIGQAAPSFWLGIVLMFIFAVKLEWVPPSGRQDYNSIILPAITMGWFYVAANLRLVRSAMLDVLDSEYIKLARAKGVSERGVIWSHALRNALITPLTFAGVTLGAMVTGSLVVETVFAWPGLGKLAIDALFANDYAILQAVVIIFSLIYVGAAFLVDVLYAYIDPRIRYGTK